MREKKILIIKRNGSPQVEAKGAGQTQADHAAREGVHVSLLQSRKVLRRQNGPGQEHGAHPLRRLLRGLSDCHKL